MKYEAPACDNDQRAKSLFAHIYGPLNVSAIVKVIDFVSDADGRFELPEIFTSYGLKNAY